MTNSLFLLVTDLLAYFMLFVLCWVSTLNSSNSIQDVLRGEGSFVHINLKHFISILIIVVLFFWHLDHDLSVTSPFIMINRYLIWIVPVPVILVLYISLCSKIPGINEKLNPYSNSQCIFYILLRIIYLVSYEIFFRNLLLNSLVHSFNIPVAIITSSLLYCLIHAINRRIEFLLSLPFGILLAWLTIETLSIYPAIILHLLLSVPFELRSFNYLNKPMYGKDILNWSNRLHW